MTGGVTDDERRRLAEILARRLGRRGDGAELAEAYLTSAERHAYERTVQFAPVPTTLTVERSDVLLEISRSLGRVVEDFEIQALFRVTPSQARAMRSTLLASYGDVTDDLTIRWALRDAQWHARRRGKRVIGRCVEFLSEERRDAFIDQMNRTGVGAEIINGEDAIPWFVIVDDSFGSAHNLGGSASS